MKLGRWDAISLGSSSAMTTGNQLNVVRAKTNGSARLTTPEAEPFNNALAARLNAGLVSNYSTKRSQGPELYLPHLFT